MASGSRIFFHSCPRLEPLSGAGYDVWTLDCRRMGLSKHYAPNDWDPLYAHYSKDFNEYAEEIDMTIGKMSDYARIVLYGNSTGGLIATNYLKSTTASKISGLALNGPFFAWDLSAAEEIVTSKAFLVDAYARFIVGGKGDKVKRGTGDVNPGRLLCRSQFYWSLGDGLNESSNNIVDTHVTADWSKAVTKAQKFIRSPESKTLKIPIFVISSRQDNCLDSSETLHYSDFLGPNRTEVEVHNANHDVFKSVTKEIIDESMGYLLTWLKRYQE